MLLYKLKKFILHPIFILYLSIPISGIFFYFLHRGIIGKFKITLAEETPVNLQIVFYGINVAYLLNARSSLDYSIIITITQIFLIICCSVIVKLLHEHGEKNKLLKFLLFILLFVLPSFGLIIMAYSMHIKEIWSTL